MDIFIRLSIKLFKLILYAIIKVTSIVKAAINAILLFTKNIFYTAITRAKNKLKIYWNSDSQTKIFDNFDKRENNRDLSILRQKIDKKDVEESEFNLF